MMRRHYMALAAASVIAAALAPTMVMAQDGPVKLCAGRAGGGYDATMRTIAAELERQGVDVEVANLDGSEAILNGIVDGTCDYGPAQKNVHYLMSKQSGAVTSKAVPVSLLYNEVVTMMCSKDSGYDELSDLKEGDGVIVNVIGSGSALTWESMVAVETEFGNGSAWIKATPIYTPLDEAMASISLGQAKCAIGVGSVPISWAKEMNEQGAVVGWVYDKDLNDLEYAGSSLYEEVRVPYGAYDSKFDTYKVPAVLFRSSKFKDEKVDRIVKRVAPAVGAKRNTVK